MTRNGDRDVVRGTSLRHRTHRLRRPDPLGDLAVACGRAGRDIADGGPYPLLERGAADVERQVEPLPRRLDEAHDLGHESLEPLVAADEARVRKAVLQTAHQCLGIVAELDGAHTFVRGRDQDRTERALANRKADDVTAAAGAELRRRHAEQVGRGGVEAAVGIKARAIDRLGDGIAGGEFLAHALAAMAGGICLRRHPGHRLEHAVEVEAAHARGLRQRVEARRLLGFFDQPAGARDRSGMRLGKGGLVRPAALARPKSRPLGVGASFVESHVLAPRQSSRA